MVKWNRREIILHDNSHDIQKVEFNIDEMLINIDKRLLNKINRQNRRK